MRQKKRRVGFEKVKLRSFEFIEKNKTQNYINQLVQSGSKRGTGFSLRSIK